MLSRDRAVSVEETLEPVDESERFHSLAVADLQHKLNQLSGLNRELRAWERRQDTQFVEYSEQIENLEAEIEQLEEEIEHLEEEVEIDVEETEQTTL